MNLRSFLLQLLVRTIVFSPEVAKATDVGKYLPLDADAWENDFGSYPHRLFHSADLVAPVVRKAADSPECHDDNYVFLALRGKQVLNPSVTILDNDGEVVWAQHVKGEPYNLNVQEYRGKQVLTYWLGDDTVGGHGEGTFYVYDTSYKEIARIAGSPGLRPDLHELIITPEGNDPNNQRSLFVRSNLFIVGTAIITIFQVHLAHQPGIFRLKDTVWIWDCLVQELDISTGKTVFQWRASDHHLLNETYRPMGGDGFSKDHPWDFYHINSVEKDEVGNYLISARYTNSITYIDGRSGKIIWVLGGKRNTFEDLSSGSGKATDMSYQHVARFHRLEEFPTLYAEKMKALEKPGVTRRILTAFDNAADDWRTDRMSRGVLIELTYPTNAEAGDGTYTAKLIKSYEHPAKFIALSQGSLQVIPSVSNTSDPKVLVGYGHVGVWTEFSADGKVLCDHRLSTEKSWRGGPVQNYRVYKSSWVGRPASSPSAVLGTGSSLFVSWNGATEVKAWALQALRSDEWLDLETVPKKTFETQIGFDVGEGTRFLRVVALDKEGQPLGRSAEVDLRSRTGIWGSPSVVFLLVLLALFVAYKGFRRFSTARRMKSDGYDKLPKYA